MNFVCMLHMHIGGCVWDAAKQRMLGSGWGAGALQSVRLGACWRWMSSVGHRLCDVFASRASRGAGALQRVAGLLPRAAGMLQ